MVRRSRTMRTNSWLSVLALLALVLAACVPAPQGPTSTPAAPTATLPPTLPPVPTVTPMPLPPPQLALRQPAQGEEQALDAPIVLTFDEPMDQASVQAALTISPTVEGVFTWSDDHTLTFQPTTSLERGARYQVTVAETARNVEGLPLLEPVAFSFTTTGYLTVSQVTPAPDSQDLSPNTTVTVVFDRPVVPLTSIGQQSGLPDPLTFVPPVQGKGEWLNTSIYLFRPDEGLLPATRYKARVAAGLSDTTGGVLAEDYVWEFTTIRPAVLNFAPSNDFKYVVPTDVISVTFNQPMDHASAQAGFRLESDAGKVAGTFRWSGAEKPNSPESMIFVPDQPMPRATDFRATLAQGIQARAGDVGTTEEVVWSFSTVKNPGVVSTLPRNGATNVKPGQSVEFHFAGPMDRKAFMDHLVITPKATDVHTGWSEFDTQVTISFKQGPVTTYSVALDANTPDKYGARLGKATIVRFSTGNLAALAALNTTAQLSVYSAYTDTVVYASYRNVSQLDLGLYRLDLKTLFPLISHYTDWDSYTPNKEDLVRQWSVKAQAGSNKMGLARLELTDDQSQPLPPGLYYLELRAPEIKLDKGVQPSRFIFIKSRLNLTLKQTHTEALVWATDLSSGQPVPNTPITLYDSSGQSVGTGATNLDGLFDVQGLKVRDLWATLYAISGEPGDSGFSLVSNTFSDGIDPWEFNVDSEFWASNYQAYVYTERPIYRPGQTVYFKGIVRADDDAHYSLPTEIQTVQVKISDPQGKELYSKNLPLNDMGTLNDQLVLDAEAPLGSYWVDFQAPQAQLYAGTSFQVAEYKAPEYQVSVTTDRDAYPSGDTINVTAEASYYFGGPVADASVHWSALSSSYYFDYACPQGESCPYYSWSDYDWSSQSQGPDYGGYGQLIAEGDARTDAQGRVIFQVPADISKATQSQLFTLEASVTDLTGQQVSNRTGAIVHKGEYYIGVAPRAYVAQAGQEATFDLLTVDWYSKPVAQGPLTITFMEHNWFSVRRQAEDGSFYWEWTARDTPVLTTTVTTSADGRAVMSFVPKKAGTYKVRAIGRDMHENEIRSAAYIWVWGGGEAAVWRQESTNRIDLVADKQEYRVGDEAEILIPSPYQSPVQALVTVERGHLMSTEVRQLKTNSEVVRIPITDDDVPNLFVSVVLVQGSEQAADGLASFKMGLIKLPVSLESKQLKISLTPDKDMATGQHYTPRQTATYDVLVTDYQDKPIVAELSLRLADLAVLALASEPGPTLEETFWRSRGLGVRTSMPLVVSMERYNRELRPAAKGGGGGEEGLVRSRFADTAFWDPVVRTDKDGKAQVQVQLPDNLTTWRMQARGISADTKVGQTNVDVLSTLDLLVRPVLPRFFVVNDQAEIATVVHNSTDKAVEAQVNIAAEGLALSGAVSQTVSVPAGGDAKVVWPVKVLPGSQVKVRMWAQAGDLYDGREDSLPVYPYTTPEVVATAGQLSEPGTRQELVQLPRQYDPAQGALTVQIDGSLTAATQDALTYLESYPYECVEQTVSRFLPNVVTWEALDQMGIADPNLRQKLSQMVGAGLQRLYNQQHYDGGWGWWVSSKSDPYLTAYVLQGMLEAHRAEFVVDQDVMTRAAAFLGENLPSVGAISARWEANRLAYELYVLADYNTAMERSGSGELGLAVRLYDKRHLLSHYGQAYLAVTLSLLESPDGSQRVQTLLSDLGGSAVVSATGTHWEEDQPDYWNMNTDIRTTAIVLWAVSRLSPSSDLLPNVVRWLMAARQDGYWRTTQSTAWSLLSLVQYMRASGELEGDFGWDVHLNGEQLASGAVAKENIAESQKLQVEIARLLTDQANRLVIERQAPQGGQTGKGTLYYSANLKYYLPADQVKALNRGIMVARQYSPTDKPSEYVDTAQVGDVIKVKLTIIAPTDLYYVVVEDPLPAGFEGVDLSLQTTSVVGEAPELQNLSAQEQERYYGWYGWGWWWFSSSQLRDEKAVLFADYLPRGTYEYTYLIRASVPGQYFVMPSTAYQMYFPEVFGRSDGGKFTVEPGQ